MAEARGARVHVRAKVGGSLSGACGAVIWRAPADPAAAVKRHAGISGEGIGMHFNGMCCFSSVAGDDCKKLKKIFPSQLQTGS